MRKRSLKDLWKVLKLTWITCPMALIIAFSSAQGYELFFVKNPDFDSNIGGWYTAFENPWPYDHQTTPGTAEWSSDYGGSAHLTVDGAPSVVALVAWLGTTVYPGDTLVCRVTHSYLGNFGGVHLTLGGFWADFYKSAGLPDQSEGTHDIILVADRIYPPGTGIQVHLVVWPGQAEAWIQYVHLLRGGPVGVEESPAPWKSRTHLTPSSFLNPPAPNPTVGNVKLTFSLAERNKALLRIYDASGRLIKVMDKGFLDPGLHTAIWDGTDDHGRTVPSGIYFYELQAGKMRTTRRSVRLR